MIPISVLSVWLLRFTMPHEVTRILDMPLNAIKACRLILVFLSNDPPILHVFNSFVVLVAKLVTAYSFAIIVVCYLVNLFVLKPHLLTSSIAGLLNMAYHYPSLFPINTFGWTKVVNSAVARMLFICLRLLAIPLSILPLTHLIKMVLVNVLIALLGTLSIQCWLVLAWNLVFGLMLFVIFSIYTM